MSFTAFIFARGGSKGLPGKHLKPIGGKSLIRLSIEQALSVDVISRVVVSTDDEDIASVARRCGAEVPFLRPSELASDTAAEWLAWQHAINKMSEIDGCMPDPFISVPATAPLRLPEDISHCLDLYLSGNADAVIAVTECHRNPWFNMVKQDSSGFVSLVNSFDDMPVRRQDAPTVFDMTTIAYVVDPKFVLSSDALFKGRVQALQVPVDRAIDIDTEYDFSVAKFLLESRSN